MKSSSDEELNSSLSAMDISSNISSLGNASTSRRSLDVRELDSYTEKR